MGGKKLDRLPWGPGTPPLRTSTPSSSVLCTPGKTGSSGVFGGGGGLFGGDPVSATAPAGAAPPSSPETTVTTPQKEAAPATEAVTKPRGRKAFVLPAEPSAMDLDEVLWRALENARLNSLKKVVGVKDRVASTTGSADSAVSGRRHKANRRTRFGTNTQVRFHDDTETPEEWIYECFVEGKKFDGQSEHRALHNSVPKRGLDEYSLRNLASLMTQRRIALGGGSKRGG